MVGLFSTALSVERKEERWIGGGKGEREGVCVGGRELLGHGTDTPITAPWNTPQGGEEFHYQVTAF
jgi:hypothetical protein